MDLDFLLRAVQVANVRYVDEVWGNFRLIEGTKTLADMHSGTVMHRQDHVMRRYRKDLPLPQRMRVFIFSHLLTWNKYRRNMAQTYLGNALAYFEQHDFHHLRHRLIVGLLYDPAALRHRWVISIGLESMIGSALMGRFRRLRRRR
jgi:hypothetical protein